MAEYFHEGFDNYYQASDLTLNVGKVQWYGIDYQTSLGTGRGNQGKSLAPGAVYFTTTQNFTEAYIGMGFMSGTYSCIQFMDALTGTVQCSVYFDPTHGYVTIFGGGSMQSGAPSASGTLLYTSSANAINAANWAFLEIHVLINASAGAVTVKYNNATVASVTGVKTQYSANAWFNSVNYASNHYNPMYIDDLRLFDTTTGPGSYPCNSWGGDLRVQTIYPRANSTVTWTPLSGTNYSEINDPGTHAIGTTYNSTTTVGNEDSFAFQLLSSVISEIISVQIKGTYTETDAASHTIQQNLNIAGTDYNNSDTWTLASGGLTMFTDLFAVNPATSNSWTLTDVNSMLGTYKAIS